MKPAVDVIYRDLDSSAALNEVISRKVEKLNRFTDQIIHSRVVLDTPHNHKHKGKQYRRSGMERSRAPGPDKDAGTDDTADAEENEVPRPERPLQFTGLGFPLDLSNCLTQ